MVKGVERITLKKSAGKEELDKQNLPVFERAQKLALQYRGGMQSIREGGWTPDIIISHSAWGCGLYAKEIFPDSKFISYSEWWFKPNSQFFQYDPNNKDLGISNRSIQKAWQRNQHMALELALADDIVSPTTWQRDQLPKIFRDNCKVIFDGVDESIFFMKSSPGKDNLKVTYGTRGMDPMRCFPQFIKTIPKFLKYKPEATIEIAGRDESFYGPGKPTGSKFKSWKAWACDYLEKNNVQNNVIWVGHMKLEQYVSWLKSSHCHVYLTHPFVPSWSLVEAYCVGAPIVTSDILATREICETNKGVWYADHRETEEIVDAIISCTDQAHSITLAEQIKRRFLWRFSLGLAHELWRRMWLV